MASRPARYYSVSEVVVVLLVAALVAVGLDSQGLLIWTGRKSVGRFQTALLAVLVPTHRLLGRIGLTLPMQEARHTADVLAVRYAGPSTDALPEAVAERLPGEEADAGPDLLEMEPVAILGTDRPDDDGDLRLLEANADAGPLAPAFADAGELAEVEVEVEVEPDAGTTKGPLTVLLVGDSMMAAGLASAIARALEDEDDVRVVRAYKEATGLSRPDVYDWMEVLPPVIDRVKPNVVVCSLGGNDMQSIREGDDVLEAGTRRWRTEYRKRVRRFMRLLAGGHREVLWLGLPVMRAADFNDRIGRMNTIFAEEATAVERVRYQDSSPAVAGDDGAYASFGPGADGSLVQLRMDDGIHYTRAGGEAVARLALAWLHHRSEPDLTSALRLRTPSAP